MFGLFAYNVVHLLGAEKHYLKGYPQNNCGRTDEALAPGWDDELHVRQTAVVFGGYPLACRIDFAHY